MVRAPSRRAGSGKRSGVRHLAALTTAKRLARGRADVHAVDFGFAYVEGERTDRTSVRFHVFDKKPLSAIPETSWLPDEIDGIDIDVLGSSYMLHDASPRTAQAMLCPGLSIGNARTKTTGTLGALVKDRATGKLCLLSNWHVLCGAPEAQVGDAISQPGPFDLGSNPLRPVAELERWLRLSEQYDAALANVLPGTAWSQQLFATALNPASIADPTLGLRVAKSGATSGVTFGVIDGVDGTYKLDYTGYGDGPEWMSGFRIVPVPGPSSSAVSLEGDSGALWVDEAGKVALGLHFAGEDGLSPLNDYALAHPLPAVFRRLNLELAAIGEV